MDIFAITLIICGSILVLSVPCFFIIEEISFKQLEKSIKKDEAREIAAEQRLTKSLFSLCKSLGISINDSNNLGTAAGHILFWKMNDGRYNLDDCKIEILKRYYDEPWVLAHELGHYMSIKQRQDESEESANAEALVLCKSILTKEEQSALRIALQCYFETKIDKT